MHQEDFKINVAVLTTVISLICLLGCAITRPQTLEFEQVLYYKLSLNSKTQVPESISGACGASAYCVQGVVTETNGAVLMVLVKIGLCKDGQTGGFSYPINVGDGIKELRFGTKKYLIWKR